MILFSKHCRSLTSVGRIFYFHFHNVNSLIPTKPIRLYSAEVGVFQKKTVRSMRRKKTFNLEPFSWVLLVIPVASFGLGVWQIQRKMWKDNLIKELEERASLPPVDLPGNLEELENMEYMAVKVKGKFDHSKEILMGPRTCIFNGSKNSASSFSLLSSKVAGFLVVTPFTLSDRNLTILVNRGWVPAEKKNPKTRLQSQVTEEVEITGLVRLCEKIPPLGVKNIPEKGLWMYRDPNKMAEITGAAPIFIDAVKSGSNNEGPVGGQTIVGLRNEHFAYIVTWFSLSFCTGYMWWLRFIK